MELTLVSSVHTQLWRLAYILKMQRLEHVPDLLDYSSTGIGIPKRPHAYTYVTMGSIYLIILLMI